MGCLFFFPAFAVAYKHQFTMLAYASWAIPRLQGEGWVGMVFGCARALHGFIIPAIASPSLHLAISAKGSQLRRSGEGLSFRHPGESLSPRHPGEGRDPAPRLCF